MKEVPDPSMRHMTGPRLLARLDKMLASGRITNDDAERLRSAAQSGDLDAEARRIRFKHARARVDAAVADGRMTQEEATSVLRGVEKGGHVRLFRGLRRR